MRKYFIQLFVDSEQVGHIYVKSLDEALDIIRNIDMQCNLMQKDSEGYYNEHIGRNFNGDLYGIEK